MRRAGRTTSQGMASLRVALKETQLRLKRVHAFLRLPGTLQYLKRTSLALQLTGHSHSICAKLDPNSLPVLVQLSRGRVRDDVLRDFWRVASALDRDDVLDAPVAMTLLIGVAIDTLVRFKQYEGYPYLLHALCKEYNPEYSVACLDFLQVA